MAFDEPPGWVPESCSLPTAEQPLRVAEFDRLFGQAVLGWDRPSATRLDLALAADAEDDARDLAAREVGCCSFFGFEFDSDGSNVVMRIEVPPSRAEVLDAVTERVASAVRGPR